MGQFTQAEVHSSRGRADAVVKTPKFVYVFEFKLKGTAGQTLQQIEEKGIYASLCGGGSASDKSRCGVQCGKAECGALDGGRRKITE